MTTPKNILLPYNSSSAAQQAVPYALDLAARTGATLHTLSVEVLRGGMPIPSGTPDGIVEDAQARFTQANEERARGRYAPEDVHFLHAARRDIEAAPAILLYAAAQDIDLIVMGTHGRTGLKRFALGSVAEKVVRWAPCPVLTTKRRTKKRDAAAPSIRHILVPTDFSAGSREALSYARTLATLFEAEIDLFHAVEETLHPAFYGPGVQSIYDAQPDVEGKMMERLEAFRGPIEGSRVTLGVAPGPAAQAIAERAEQADLVVMATRERTMLEHLVTMGSVPEKVVRTAPCPVLTARRFGQTLIGADDEGSAAKREAVRRDVPMPAAV